MAPHKSIAPLLGTPLIVAPHIWAQQQDCILHTAPKAKHHPTSGHPNNALPHIWAPPHSRTPHLGTPTKHHLISGHSPRSNTPHLGTPTGWHPTSSCPSKVVPHFCVPHTHTYISPPPSTCPKPHTAAGSLSAPDLCRALPTFIYPHLEQTNTTKRPSPPWKTHSRQRRCLGSPPSAPRQPLGPIEIMGVRWGGALLGSAPPQSRAGRSDPPICGAEVRPPLLTIALQLSPYYPPPPPISLPFKTTSILFSHYFNEVSSGFFSFFFFLGG